MTPHISAKKGDFAKTVLMPGDPKRSKFIAENFLENPVLVNDVRGVQGYTGTYKGVPVSVMASGMGMPSMGIYSYELFKFYGVENIIRVGSAGALVDYLDLYDIVIADTACTDSNMISSFNVNSDFVPTADKTLLDLAVLECEKNNHPYKVGKVFSSDCFYSDKNTLDRAKEGAIAVEMETTALYLNASIFGKRALTILTISDSLVSGKETTSAERQTAFTDMMTVALEVAVKMDGKNV
ncbi:MAG: purine-nucleoside phosphorylase [Clostridia bacterium]|nr:purine-nucleoside phosphorylase [Clostridia bacterium]